jgi:sulfide:quinone oxidoreductase
MYVHYIAGLDGNKGRREKTTMRRVIVLGGGIGGVEAAIALRKEGLEVELVSDRDFLFVYPLAIWIPTGERPYDRVQISLADIARVHGFALTLDEVVALSGADRTFTLRQGGTRQDFDYLVLALGAHKTAHRGKEHFLSICGPPQESVTLKERFDSLVAKGTGTIAVGFGGNPKDPSGVRGGPAFEFLLNVHHRLKKLGIRDRFELVFFTPMPEPGIRMGEKAVRMMDRMLSTLGIRSYTGKKITEFGEGAVHFEDGTQLQADLVMFIAAGDGHAVVKVSDLPRNEAGFVSIEPSCVVKGHPWLYAVGDVAALEGPDWRAKQGHLAEVMARVAVADIVGKGNGRAGAGYVDKVCILCLMDMGNGAGFVYRDAKRARFIPLPIVGHWLKRAWGLYYRLRKLRKMPRLPGL